MILKLVIIFIIVLIIINIICNYHYLKTKLIVNFKLHRILHKYKKVKINMSIDDMLSIMKVDYITTTKNNTSIYKFDYTPEKHFITKPDIFQEHYVTIECIDNKVSKVIPYNMNNIKIPKDFINYVYFAEYLHIVIK